VIGVFSFCGEEKRSFCRARARLCPFRGAHLKYVHDGQAPFAPTNTPHPSRLRRATFSLGRRLLMPS
jgi:hypothetical protein